MIAGGEASECVVLPLGWFVVDATQDALGRRDGRRGRQTHDSVQDVQRNRVAREPRRKREDREEDETGEQDAPSPDHVCNLAKEEQERAGSQAVPVSHLASRWERNPRHSRRGSCHPCQLRRRHVEVPFDRRGYDDGASLEETRHGHAHRRRRDEQDLLRRRAENCRAGIGRRLIFRRAGDIFGTLFLFNVASCFPCGQSINRSHNRRTSSRLVMRKCNDLGARAALPTRKLIGQGSIYEKKGPSCSS